jgi:two-component system, chemotaxis family, sensor kinase CheA
MRAMPSRVDLKEFVSGFLLESDEHLHAVNRNLVAVTEALASGRPEPRAVRELFRSLHTIKGLASMVGAEPIADLAHEMEGVLRLADAAGGRLSEVALDLLAQGTRALEERVQLTATMGLTGIPPAPRALLDALALEQHTDPRSATRPEIELGLADDIARSLGEADREQLVQAAEAGLRTLQIEFEPSADKAAQGYSIGAARSRLAELGEVVRIVPHASPRAPTGIAFCLLVITRADDATLAAAVGGDDTPIREISITRGRTVEPPPAALEPAPPPDWVPRDHSIRVDIQRLDDALERLSELVVTRFKLARLAAELGARGVDTRELLAVIAENASQLKKLRAAITAARMVPLADLLQRLPLVVRGLTRDTRKTVTLTTRLGGAEVDKAVADRIFPAIVHLVRNAVDHAIEPRDERTRSGKPEAGDLRIVCDDVSAAGLVLTVSDDGRGIDRVAVARKLGRAPAETDDELLQQITTSGLSTRDDVTQTSGRGMGMDIVRRTVEMLGGTLSLHTTSGKGSAFTIRVPVSVTIVDVFSFEAGDQVFVAPVAMVEEILEIAPASLRQAPAPARQGVVARLVERRGEAIPLLALAALLRLDQDARPPPKALIVQHDRRAIAFGVDRMLGQQEVVIRPLHDALVRTAGVVGATDLGDGKPTLVLDLLTLGAASALHKAGAP